VGGAFLTMSAFNAFFFNMVNGRGWICIALVVFASWRPGKACSAPCSSPPSTPCSCACSRSWADSLPYQLFLMLPYALDPRAGGGRP
jgi:ABC-type uncharacterized transport system permease subunit